MNASFNAAIKNGVSMVEALDQLGPGLDDTLTTMQNLGVSVEGHRSRGSPGSAIA